MDKKKKENYRVLLRLGREAAPIGWGLALAAGMNLTSVLCAVAAPQLLGKIIQRVCDGAAAGALAGLPRALLPSLALLLACYAGSQVLSYGNIALMNRLVTSHFTCGFRVRISEKLSRLPVGYVDQTPVGEVLSRMTGDVGDLGGYLHQVFDGLVLGAFQLAAVAVAMFRENPALACFVVVLTPLSLWLTTQVSRVCTKNFDAMFDSSEALTGVTEEAFSNFETARAYALEDFTQDNHEKKNHALSENTFRAHFTAGLVAPVVRLTNAAAYILIALLGGWLILRGTIGVGTVVTVILYAQQFASPLEMLGDDISYLHWVVAAANRVYGFLDLPEEPVQTGALPEQTRGAVEFQNVTFGYRKDEPILKDISFRAEPGQKIAIVGPTGGGKTTLVNLLMRFYDPDSGAIFLDGQDTAQIDREQVRGRFAMVLQDTWLFPGTLRENVAYGSPGATMAEIERACRRTHCHRLITAMPQGYDTPIREDSANLSGGQKQLLTIARAFLADRPLLILDEATSNVDTRTEILIQRAMDTLMKGRTSFVIAHRLSTIVDADKILVIDQGRLIEEGTHQELLEKKGFYYQLYSSQYEEG